MSEQKRSIFQRLNDWWFQDTPKQKAMLDLHPELRDREPLMRVRGLEMWVASDYSYKAAVIDYGINVWMNKAVKLISDAVAPVPLEVVQDGKPVQVDVPLLTKPNGTQAPADLWRSWAVSMMLGGECGFETVYAKDQKTPLEWWARTPDEIRVIPNPARARYNDVAGFIIDDGSGDPYALDPLEFVHFKFYNPADKWRGVSPFMASRMSMKIDRHAREWAKDFFENSARPDFAVLAPEGTTKTERDEILSSVLAMYRGTQNGVIVLESGQTDIKTLSFAPKDINFVEQREMSRDEVAAAAGIPDILMGFGNDSYDTADKRANAEATMWSLTIKPLLDYRDQVLTKFLRDTKIIAENQEVRSNLSEVMALKQRVDIFQYHIDGGIVTRDEVRATLGFPTDAQTDSDEVLYNLRRQLSAMQLAVAAGYDPISASKLVGLPPPPENPAPAPSAFGMSLGMSSEPQDTPAQLTGLRIINPKAKGLAIPKGSAVQFGSELHRELWTLAVSRTDAYEKRFALMVEQLFKEQQAAIIAKVNREAKSIAELGDDPFDQEEWDAIFAKRMLPEYKRMVAGAGNAAIDDVGATIDFNLLDPRVVSSIRRLSQRFAKRVNETTWQALKDTLAKGIEAGEGADKLAARVEEVMTLRINQSSGSIARTETMAGYSTGSMEGWRQSGVDQKTWIATFDDRTRDTHAEAHGQTVGIDEDFEVGTATGQGPGLMDEAGESINCRCAMLAVTK